MQMIETPWTPTESQIVYRIQPDEHVAQPCIVRLLDGSLIILVQQTGSGPIFIRSADGRKTWSEPYRGILPNEVGRVSTLGIGRGSADNCAGTGQREFGNVCCEETYSDVA